MVTPPRPVLLFDAECGLCNAVVRTMLRWDRRGVLSFASLQGRTGQGFLRIQGLATDDFDSLVFIVDLGQPDAGFFFRTDGALAALAQLGCVAERIARVLRFVPISWRDALYRGVARWRYRIFGRNHPQPALRPEWTQRILD
jgi:predicted DCC family thiol-disulfide oxidoreductase YuxK